MKNQTEKDIQFYITSLVIYCYKNNNFDHAARWLNLLNTRNVNVKQIIDYIAFYGVMIITLEDGLYLVKRDKSKGKQDLKKILNNMSRFTYYQYIRTNSNADAAIFDKTLFTKLQKISTEVQTKKVQICNVQIKKRKAQSESSFIQNKQILDYLSKNPADNGMGKFGVPQDKYRYGFYGSGTKEYDIWRKGDKEI